MNYKDPNNYSRVAVGEKDSDQTIDRIIDRSFGGSDLCRDRKRRHTYNVPCAFDIETTSYMSGEEKRACLYVWQLGINGDVILGRTWEEFIAVMDRIAERLKLSSDRYLIVYVHNLAFEFQFMRKWFQWEEVFAMESRKPIYARTVTGIEFRCSYMLSGYSLRKVGEHLTRYRVEKLVGDLDYDLIRHPQTPLTEKEIGYCVNDVLVVMAYIQEKIESDGKITKIPLTKTGYVRNYCRERCYHLNEPYKKNFARGRFREIIKNLTLDADEYAELKRAFQGGFTHASPYYSGRIMEDITSFDFTSSYPTVMVAEMFPMSPSEPVCDLTCEEFEESLDLYCCLFDVHFVGLNPRLLYDNYISASRCRDTKNVVTQNGRVVSADELTTTITEQDFKIIREYYTWDDMFVSNFRRYRKGYLPTDFVKAILQLYEDKTKLKGVEGKEAEYLNSKEMLNSCYGMAVTDIVRDEIVYDDDWAGSLPPNVEEVIAKYNDDRKRFLYYPWGVWVTAYARRNLFTGILEFGPDYVYSDTDSVKVRHAERHKDYIEQYNKLITEKLERACRFHRINPESLRPKTIEGKEKPLGVWDFDGHYRRFKTLGAKRYMVEKDDGEYSLTVSGLNKKVAIPYLKGSSAEKDVMELFEEGLHVPKGYTGGNVHTYIDDAFTEPLTDYTGVTAVVSEKTCVHLAPDEYTMSIPKEYLDYIMSIGGEDAKI